MATLRKLLGTFGPPTIYVVRWCDRQRTEHREDRFGDYEAALQHARDIERLRFIVRIDQESA